MIVPAAVACVVVAVAAGTAWYLLSEERRMGSVVERVLVAPAGRTVSVVAKSAFITLPTSSASGGSSVEPLRSLFLTVLGWTGELKIRVEGSELHTARGVLTVDLTGAKQGPGLTLALTVAPHGKSEALRLSVRGAAALGRSLDLAVDVDVAGSPRIVAVLWPAVTPPASPVAGRVQLQLVAGGVISAYGRPSFGADGQSRTALDFTSRYDSTSGELSVSRYSLRWGEDVRVTGTARLARAASERRVTATVDGDALGTKVSAPGATSSATERSTRTSTSMSWTPTARDVSASTRRSR